MQRHVVVTWHASQVFEDCTVLFGSVVVPLHAVCARLHQHDFSELWPQSTNVARLFVQCTGTFACETVGSVPEFSPLHSLLCKMPFVQLHSGQI